MKEPFEFLEELAEKVINNRFNELGAPYYVAFGEVVSAFNECGLIRTQAELDMIPMFSAITCIKLLNL